MDDILDLEQRVELLTDELARLRAIEQRARETVEVELKGSPRRDVARYILGEADHG